MIDILYVLVNLSSREPVTIFFENKQCMEAASVLKKEMDLKYECRSIPVLKINKK